MDFKTLFDSETHEGRRKAMQMGVVALNLGTPEAVDDDHFVEDGNMKNGAYTLAAKKPDVPRNLRVTVTKATGNDTMGKLTIKGKDFFGQAIEEEIVPNNGDTSSGVKDGDLAFAEIESITGSGWVISAPGQNDQIKIGYGNKIGLPVALSTIDDVVLCLFDRAVQTHTAVVADPASVAGTTIDASAGTYDGAKVMQALVAARE